MRDGGDKKKLHHIPGLRNNSGSLAMFAAIRRASSRVSGLAPVRLSSASGQTRPSDARPNLAVVYCTVQATGNGAALLTFNAFELQHDPKRSRHFGDVLLSLCGVPLSPC